MKTKFFLLLFLSVPVLVFSQQGGTIIIPNSVASGVVLRKITNQPTTYLTQGSSYIVIGMLGGFADSDCGRGFFKFDLKNNNAYPYTYLNSFLWLIAQRSSLSNVVFPKYLRLNL